jgi:hypothetical protein
VGLPVVNRCGARVHPTLEPLRTILHSEEMRHSLRASMEIEQHLLGPVSVQDRVRAKRMAEEAKQARFKRQPLSGRDYMKKAQERTASIIEQCPRGASARHGQVVSAGLLSEPHNKQGRGLYRAEIAGINARYARVSYVDHGEFDVSEEQYRAEGHKPEFDDLLSREDYDTANRPGARSPGTRRLDSGS